MVARSFAVALMLALLLHAPSFAATGSGSSSAGTVAPGAGTWLAQQDSQDSEDTVAGQLLAHAELGTFADLVEGAGLIEIFRRPGPMTLFAPTDEAFEPYRDGRLEELRSQPQALERFIRYHILENDIILVPGGTLSGNGSLNPIGRVLFWPLQ